jgi:hypothetical protein
MLGTIEGQNELDMFKDDVPTTQQTYGFRYENQPVKAI